MIRIVVICIIFGMSLGALPARSEEAVVAVAVNFASATQKIVQLFERTGAHNITVVTGSTGKLSGQIALGAPFDVFLAADQQRPAALEASGLAVQGSRFTYAQGKLVLWAAHAFSPTDTLESVLSQWPLRHVAMANPKLAPYGAAAFQALERLGLSRQLNSKLVYGESVGQAFGMVASGNAEVGFVALAQLPARGASANGVFLAVPQTLYDPILQDAVLLKRGMKNKAAVEFMNFLKSREVAELIVQQGYMVPQ